MKDVGIIGGDLAKNLFQLHGAAADGTVVFRKKLSRQQFQRFIGSSAVPGGDGGLWRRASLGPRTGGSGSRGQTDRTALCQTIHQAAEKRR